MLYYFDAFPKVTKLEKQQGQDSNPCLPDFKAPFLYLHCSAFTPLPGTLAVNKPGGAEASYKTDFSWLFKVL